MSGGLLILLLFLLNESCEKDNTTPQSKVVLFNPNLTYSTLTDIDGNSYNTITIGEQNWMAENLKTTRFNDSSSISLIEDNSAWGNLMTSGYSRFSNDGSR
jgi:hypothetical protein